MTASQKTKNKNDPKTPQEEGETSISGHMPNPSADDNALDSAQKAGLYEDADQDNPQPLGVGREINKDEKERHGRS